MDDMLKFIIIVLAVNLLCAILVYIIQFRKNKTKGLLLALIIIFVPVLAVCYLVMIEIFKLFMKIFRLDTVDISELAAKGKITVIEEANIEVDRDKVPLEESLIISDRLDKRKAFLETLKTDVMDSISFVKMAVEDSDSEISHYAAAFLTEEIAKFKRNEIDLYNDYKKREDLKSLYNYAEYVGDFLSKNIMTIEETKRYIKLLDDKLWKIIELSDKPLEGEYIREIVIAYKYVDEKEKVIKWINYALKNSSTDLDSAKVCLNHYFGERDYTKFKNVMEDIKSSAMFLDHETVELIRFFNSSMGKVT